MEQLRHQPILPARLASSVLKCELHQHDSLQIRLVALLCDFAAAYVHAIAEHVHFEQALWLNITGAPHPGDVEKLAITKQYISRRIVSFLRIKREVFSRQRRQ